MAVRSPFSLAPGNADQKLITVLSIDGGGVRGIIPATILTFLESELQKLDGKNARIADYFNLIAGTSTGSIVTAMLTTPQRNGTLREAREIISFYFRECPNIFGQQTSNQKQPRKEFKVSSLVKNFLQTVGEVAVKYVGAIFLYPKYDGQVFRDKVKEVLGKTRLDQTSTNVLITSFDIKDLNPILFSSHQAKQDARNDVSRVPLLSDVVISSAAAPYLLPPYYFKTACKQYNLVDGGVAANNPTLLAIREATKISGAPIPPDCSRYLVLSLGTGSTKRQGGYEVGNVNLWGLLDWFDGDKGTPPLLDVFFNAMEAMVNIYLSFFFQGGDYQRNYLRIQDDNLRPAEAAMDNSNIENLKRLERIGLDLLDKPVSFTNLETGLQEPMRGGDYARKTNKTALVEFAKKLSSERRRRSPNLLGRPK